MAISLLPSSFKFIMFFVIFLIFFFNGVTGIPERELEAMLSVLGSKGYNLFGNAITTSDIRYEVLAGNSYTFFAPTDGALFALDMTAPASLYVSSLRYHVVLRRLSVSDLRSLGSGTTLQTLLPKREVTIGKEGSPESDVITVDGVGVVLPGMYFGHNIAVHGLNGILDFRSKNRSVNHPKPPRMIPTNRTSISPASEPSPGKVSPSLNSPSLPPEMRSSPDIVPREYEDQASPSDSPLSYNSLPLNDLTPETDYSLDEFSPESPDEFLLPPGVLPPYLNSPDIMPQEYRNQASLSAPPLSYSSLSPVEMSMLRPPVPKPVNDRDGYLDSDLGDDYRIMQPELRVTGQCEKESMAKCSTAKDESAMSDVENPAKAPQFPWSSGGSTVHGKDL
ncbi:Fasciclin-like arabinogalactan protein [Thalictrum thalictroides]|uniref:Fasciclin-like arabinogalactan protein n=1 Tax=Thalictrum thalictroides TaxID=46969 RepID=A0A7J6X3L7_THATH|nr:Fasciclin-like arabinogalactan protein [Thalictrum thalictroides]